METNHSIIATNSLVKNSAYTKLLRGVCEAENAKKRTSPNMSEMKRQTDVGLNFLGGIGIYQIMDHTNRNRNKFNCLHHQTEYSKVKYLRKMKSPVL
jgi:hypothetical protein